MKKKILAFLLLFSTQLLYIPVPTAFAEQTGTASASSQVAAHLLAINLASLINSDPTSIIPITSSTQALVQTALPPGAQVVKGSIAIQKPTRSNFKADDDITFTVTNPAQEDFSTAIVDLQGKPLPAAIQQTTNGTSTELTITRPIQFRPGKYRIQVTDKSGKTSEQDFTWGVLALNTDRSIYQPRQTADLSMAVLDDQGNMVCDANLTLQITNASTNTNDVLSTKNGKITVNPACKSHDFSLEPDYEAHYQVGSIGSYAINLTAATKNGTYSIADKLTVADTVPLDVQRVSATRIYPPNNYPMQFHITANQDFEGTVTETVPDSFTITPSDQTASSSSYENTQTMYLSQNKDPGVNLEKNIRGASTSALPLPFSGSFRIAQGFGEQLTDTTLKRYYAAYGLGGNDGVDFGLPTGTPIFSVDDGTVIFAGQRDYGTTVIIQHSWGRSYYGNLSMITVDKDSHVTNGTLLGYSGDSSEAIGSHLHFGIKPNNPDMNNEYMGKVDPLPYFHLPETATSAFDFLSLDLQNVVLGASAPAALQIDTQTTTASVAGTDASHSAQMPVAALANQLKKDMQKTTTTDNKVKIISWHLALKKGQSTTLSYTFKVPPVSPQFYLLGPLRFFDKDSEALVFEEQRNWQIAADAVGTPWYDYNWQYRKQITIDHTKVSGGANLSNFPVLIGLANDIDLKANAQSTGNDILFTDSTSNTKLNHEIEKYTSSTGELEAWVKVPTLSASTDTILYMYYGNAAASNQQNATGVWDSNYKAVYHLANGSTLSVTDSTSNVANCTNHSATATTGKIDGAANFDGISQYISCPTTNLPTGANAWTIEAWVDLSTTSGINFPFGVFIGTDNGADPKWDAGILVFNTGTKLELTIANSDDIGQTAISTGTLYHAVGTYDGTTATFYFNGSNAGNHAETMNVTYGNFDIATSGRGSYWPGVIDEVRISNIARSAGWITTEYNDQNSPSTFYTFGNVETHGFACTLDQKIRHGACFSNGKLQPFGW